VKAPKLKAPFPWFGGKSRAAPLIWEGLGDVANYVEPFAGSLAVLLGRPTEARIETVNDADCFLANFWRAVQKDPKAVAGYADWPVNEADLHARHKWLVSRPIFREKMKTSPNYCDARIAGWWVWGLSCWIGDGWCTQRRAHEEGRPDLGAHSLVYPNGRGYCPRCRYEICKSYRAENLRAERLKGKLRKRAWRARRVRVSESQGVSQRGGERGEGG
jgi:hypothetical protein